MAVNFISIPNAQRMARNIPAVKDLAVVVVNYNTRELLLQCLSSVVREAPEDLIAIDNASSDGSPQLVRERFPDVRLVANSGNPGYAAAANEAMRSTLAPFVLLLNADTKVVAGSLSAAVDYMLTHPRAGLVGPLLRSTDGTRQRSVFPFPGTLAWLLENNPIGPILSLFPSARRRMLRYAAAEARSVPWVLGAAMLIRREAYDATSGFDESYFMYYEEVDFCFRLWEAGWEVHYAPTAEVVHVGAASTSQVRTAMAVRHFESTRRFYRHHYSGLRAGIWMALMRFKMAFRLVRDSIALPFAKGEQRRRLKEQLAAWRLTLFSRSGE